MIWPQHWKRSRLAYVAVSLFTIFVVLTVCRYGKTSPTKGESENSETSSAGADNTAVPNYEDFFKVVAASFGGDRGVSVTVEMPSGVEAMKERARQVMSVYERLKNVSSIIEDEDRKKFDNLDIFVAGGKILSIEPVLQVNRNTISAWGERWILFIYDNGTCIRQDYEDTSQYLLQAGTKVNCLLIETSLRNRVTALLFDDNGPIRSMEFVETGAEYGDGTERLPSIVKALSLVRKQ